MSDPAYPTEAAPSGNSAKPSSSAPWTRYALGAAALLALGAVGVTAYRSFAPDAPAASQSVADSTAPTVEEVISGLEKKLQADPDNAENWRMLGWSYFETGQFAESATAMRRAVSLNPDNPEYHSMLGEALVMASNGTQVPKDASTAFRTALRLDAKDPRARYFLAVEKDIGGDHQGAIEDWFALLADSPADAPYVEDIRRVITQVGQKEGIDVAARLASTGPKPATGGLATDGAQVATGAIPGPTSAEIKQAAGLPPGQQEAMVRTMVEGLAARLQKDPNDADGWIMLMRSRMTLGETAKAVAARDAGLNAFKNDGQQAKRIREAALALGVGG